ncbi:MAG: glycosyltransferase [Gemmatimonadota bacterium]
MRVAYLPGLFPVLSETPVVNQITGLVARGHEVSVFADRPVAPGRYHESIDRYRLLERTEYRPEIPRSLLQRWGGLRHLIAGQEGASRSALLRTLNPFIYAGRALSGKLAYQTVGFLPARSYDMIHGGFGEQGVKALRMKRLGAMHGPLVTAFQGADLTKYTRGRERVYARLFREGDLFLPVSQFFANRLADLGCPRDRIVVLRTGIDLRLFAFQPRQHSSTLRLVSVGRLVEKKAIDDALKMVAGLDRLGIDVTYDIIGDGHLRPSLTQLAGELGISGRVRFLGSQDQDKLPALLAACHVLITPSVTAPSGDQEGIPNVIKEAMAAGLPVVGTRHAGIPELIEHGVTGFLAPEHDPAALTQAVRTLYEHPETWGSLVAAARARIEADYDIEKQNDRLVEIYHGVITARSRGASV